MEMKIRWYVLVRDGVYDVACEAGDGDVLYGRGSWSFHSGPYTSYEAASEACPPDVNMDTDTDTDTDTEDKDE